MRLGTSHKRRSFKRRRKGGTCKSLSAALILKGRRLWTTPYGKAKKGETSISAMIAWLYNGANIFMKSYIKFHINIKEVPKNLTKIPIFEKSMSGNSIKVFSSRSESSKSTFFFQPLLKFCQFSLFFYFWQF